MKHGSSAHRQSVVCNSVRRRLGGRVAVSSPNQKGKNKIEELHGLLSNQIITDEKHGRKP